ncbi:hypothetical protein AMS68_005277 [Peltaster fructicola]|uniref:MHD domain-containing protein n=1 Tax=Peltaster fructicola TaxID=286661 RepID=A0A6H0XZC4_9PEZI|nr:hypothetical protein AMS68_005277 [Peltaster fructicola]
MLAALAPAQAVEVLNDRVGHVGKLNSEIAEWLAERRRLEESYANGLRKLARRPVQGVDLGIFSIPWSSLTTATETQAEAHASLAAKIETDVERPLRDFTKNSRELQAIATMQGNLGALAKDVDQAQSKVDKLQNRGERADSSKAVQANQELEQAQVQWESQAPYVFENLQALDEARLNHLRDVLTQLQTHEVDQVEKDRVPAEQCLNALLNVEIADEIKTFQLKAVQSRPRVERPTRQASGPSSPTNAAPVTRPSLPTTLSQTTTDDANGSLQEDEKQKKGPLKSLKRFSTVIGRKKDRGSKLPPQLDSMAEVPESKSRGFGGFGRKKKDATNLDVPAETASMQRPYSPLRIGSEAFEPTEMREVSNAASGDHTRDPNGTTAEALAPSLPNGSHQGNVTDIQAPLPGTSTQADTPRQDNEGFSLPDDHMDAITRAQQEAMANLEGTAPQYNVNIKDAPIADERNGDADAALASMASKLQMEAPPPQRRAGTIRGRRDARNSTYIPPHEPPTTSSEEPLGDLARARAFNASTASFPSSPVDPPTTSLPPVPAIIPATAAASTTSAYPPIPAAFIPQASTSTASASAFPPVPAAFNPSASTSSAFSSLQVAPEAASPLKSIPRTLTADGTGDNQSIRSGRSLASTTSQGHRHPELSENGLNVSIIESVSARFESGKLVSSSLTGEIAVAYHGSGAPNGVENIRITNFGLLEKVVPNSAFVMPAATGTEGEYTLSHANIARTQVAFKYQARSDDSGSIAPLLITTAFKIEAAQASVIVSYALNPAFVHSAPSISLSNVMLALTLEGTKATGCQSKPVGTFSREKNLIFWQLGDITLTRGAAPSKLLARFTTESEAKTGSVEARWEIVGEQTATLGSGVAITAQSHGADPFADESAQGQYKPVHTVRKLVSGSYAMR